MPKQILTIVICLLSALAVAQPGQKEKLEARKAQIQKEILENQKLLQRVKSKEKSATDELLLSKRKIELKQKLISTTERQTKILNNDMYINQVQINRLKKDLADLREDYAELIRKSYKSRSEQSRAMFLLSSESFLQAYKRAQYMKQYASYRRAQGEEIVAKAKELSVYNNKLKVQKVEKQKLLTENQKEKQDLEKEKKEQERIVTQIKKDKKQIAAEIRKKQQESKTIDKQIDKLIRDAIAAANKKTATAAKKNPAKSSAAAKAATTSAKIVLTPAGKIISDNFKANKGKLPWPVEKGYVSLGYGDQPHPVHRSLIVHNSGVEITTDPGSNARAVFGGEVTAVIVLSPVNKAIVLQHGDFFTVYQNLGKVYVGKGDKVVTGQSLGQIRTNGDTGKTVIKFTISQNTTYTNPQAWLAGM
jgi:septal ring factor EnvC (AmiA/AmiB activator)